MAYFLKKSKIKNGLYLQIYFSYRDPETKQPKNKSVRSLGYFHKLQEEGIEDPIAHFQLEVDQMNEEFKKEKARNKTREITSVSPVKSLGYFPLKSILDGLNVKKDIDMFQFFTKQDYSLAEALEALVFSRAVNPCSKHRTSESVIPSLYGDYSFSYDQILSACEMLGLHYEKIVEILTAAVAKKYGIDTSVTYFDCTNFYFEIDLQDSLRRKGMSKENRKDPIVGMSLLLDADCIPIGMRIYPGNQSEKPEIRNLIGDMKMQNNITGKTVQVADKGLNCAENIYKARKGNDGYLFSKSVKMLSEKELDWVFNDETMHEVRDSNGELLYAYKSCVDTFEYSFKIAETGEKKTFKTKEKRIVTFNPSLARKKLIEIDKMADKAAKGCLYHAKKSEFGEAAKYITVSSVDINGQENGEKAVASVNREAISRDRMFAGYNMLVTSEIKMKDQEIYDTYHNLWRIEESFRTMKSELDARPVYLQNHDRIRGHFLICYAAVLLTRIFQIKILKDKFGTHQIFELFREFKVLEVSERKYVNTSVMTDLLKTISRTYGIPVCNYHMSKGDIKKVLGYRLTPML